MDGHAEKKNTNIGYNVMSGHFVDMIKAGIIDRAKVTKGALTNAASIAAMILTTEALIADFPGANGPAMPGGMPGYKTSPMLDCSSNADNVR